MGSVQRAFHNALHTRLATLFGDPVVIDPSQGGSGDYVVVGPDTDNMDAEASDKDGDAQRATHQVTPWSTSMLTAKDNAVTIYDDIEQNTLSISGFYVIRQAASKLPTLIDRDVEGPDRYGEPVRVTLIANPS